MKYFIFGIILGCIIWSALLLAIISGTLINIKKMFRNFLSAEILNENVLAEEKVCGVPDGEFRPCLRNTSLKCKNCDKLINKL